MRRARPIDDLVRWAYRDELPRDQTTSFLRPDGFGFGWGSVARLGQLGQRVDEPDVRNRYGLAPDWQSDRGPHPDAIAIHAAVQDLTGLTAAPPDGWDPIEDFGLPPREALPQIAKGLAAGRRSVPELVRISALIAPPQWQFDPPGLVPVTDRGQPKWFRTVTEKRPHQDGYAHRRVEVDGFDRVARRPYPDAYRKHAWEPEEPWHAVRSRAEYELWHAALTLLTATLTLAEHDPLPPSVPARPWETDQPVARVIEVA